MGDFAAGTGGLLGGLLTQAMDVIYTNADRNWMSGLDTTKYLKDYDKDISDYFMNKQIDYNKWALDYQKNLQNTAYQRAIADMKAAGINPASLAGVQASSASSPNPLGLSSSNHSGVQSVSNHLGNSGFASAVMNSAINSMIAKDKNASKLLAAEIVDNARHEHRMEESRERRELDVARTKEALARGRYYDRLKSDDKAPREKVVEDEWLKGFYKRHGYDK